MAQETNIKNQPTLDTSPSMPTPGPGNTLASPAPNNKKMWFILLAILVVVAGAAAVFYAMSTQKPAPVALKIGVMGPLSGDSAAYTQSLIKGMQLAKKDLNATNIEIVQEDTMCEEDAAPDAMKRLIAQGVVAVIGDLCSSSVTLAALPEANDGKVVLISPDATNPRLSVKDDYFFRVVPPDQVQADYLSKLIYNKGHKDVAVFHSDEAYGNDITAEFTKKFEALGGKVVTTQAAERGVLELDAQVKAVVDKKPDAIVILNSSTASDIAFMKLVRAAGSDVPFFSSDGIYDASLATTAGEAAEGLIFTIYPRGTEEFQNAFAAEYGSQTPINAAAEAYDAFKALYLAIEKGATTGEQIAKTLPSIDFQGVSARIRFDEFGDNSQDYQYLALEVKDGEFVPVEE